MEMGQHRASPLYEVGDAPRILVTGIDRLDTLDEGLYCFVCTCPTSAGGHDGRKVVLYLECTPKAIATGVMFSFLRVKELMRLLRAMRFLTFH